MSCELARALPGGESGVLVVAVTTAGSATSELVRTLARLLTAELGSSARFHPELLDAAHAQRLARRDLPALLVSAELSHERFVARADLVRAAPGFWSRFRAGEPGISAHASASSLLDAELRAALPPVPLVISRIDKAAPLDEPTLALACGDLNDDGSLEIVSVGRRRIQVGRIDHGRFRAEGSAAWAQLSEVAPRPLREPIAVASIPSPGRLEVGITDRADGLRLDAALKVVARFRGQLPWPGGGCTRTLATGVAAERTACGARPAAGEPTAVDAIAGVELRTPRGEASFFASRRQDGTLTIEAYKTRSELTSVGAQLALGELNGDGRPELVSSTDTLAAETDAVIARTLSDGGAPSEAFRLPVPSGVRALAICPSEGATLAPLVIATGDGLWVVR